MAVFQAVVIGLIVLGIMIILDLVSRLCTFLKSENRSKFDWGKLLLFYKRGVAPYFGIWIAYSLINVGIVWISENYLPITIPGFADGIMAGIIYAAWLAIVLKVGKSIFDNLSELGINPPTQ